jgi:hypothetical protein
MQTDFKNKRCKTEIEEQLNPKDAIVKTIRVLYSIETK